MSYGQNASLGLVPLSSYISGSYNGQNRQYYIQSGYAFNIFKGDPVYLGGDGFIHSLFELGAGPLATAQSLGIFNGCSYEQPSAQNPTDPANPGRPYWPANTTIYGNFPYGALAYIIDDPNLVYSLQVNADGIPWNAVGDTASILFNTTGGQVNGNTNTGQSLVVLNGSTVGDHNAARNVRIIGFDQNPNNPIPLPVTGPAVPFVNALVLLQNHSYLQRAPGL